jgi:diacylglycerol kinase
MVMPEREAQWTEIAERRPPRPWGDKFREAIRGVKLGVRGHSSFFVHFFVAALVVSAAAAFQVNLLEWCVLLTCIGGVLTAELINSAIEAMVRGLEAGNQRWAQQTLDIAAGSVLVASVFAAIVGGLIFGARLLNVLGW